MAETEGVSVESVRNIGGHESIRLPERVIQFGTGVLLRGLPDYFIDKANKNGVFNGRILVVKSTTGGDLARWEKQNFSFTHVIRGISNNALIDTHHINHSISRVLRADIQWLEILQSVENPLIKLIVSNTTEQGLVYEQERLHNGVPISFPTRLLALLYRRFQALGDSPDAELLIIPTELIDKNGDLLKKYLVEGAHYNQLSDGFLEWLNRRIYFCNSLVDRIVPGTPGPEELHEIEGIIGYSDPYLIVSEPYALWAIEGGQRVKEILSFAQINLEVKIVDDITTFKELKLRLLNGAHTLSCGKALYDHFSTVHEAMNNQDFLAFMQSIMSFIRESMPVTIDSHEMVTFSNEVLSRFANPYIRHQWKSIIFNYTDKVAIRVMPLVKSYFAKHDFLPEIIIEALTYYFKLAIPHVCQEGHYYSLLGSQTITLNDPHAEQLYILVEKEGIAACIRHVVETIWLSGSEERLADYLVSMMEGSISS